MVSSEVEVHAAQVQSERGIHALRALRELLAIAMVLRWVLNT